MTYLYGLSSTVCRRVVLAMCLTVPAVSFSQVVISQQEFTSIFTSGTRFFINQTAGQFNIGRPGGPQIFDFSSFGLQNPDSSNNYAVGTISALAARYPADAVTFGQSPGDIEKNPVFLTRNDSVFVLGQASLVPAYRFVHYRPYELVARFPTVYGATFSQFQVRYDTTYNSNWQVVATDHSTSNEITTIDAYGTLRLSTGDFQCIRIRKDHTGYGDKEFIYMTREGVFADVGGVSASAPDSGVVQGFMMVLRKGSLVSVKERDLQARQFELHQNYPSPFNPSTTIKYELPTTAHVSLKVFDLLGRAVATLVDEVQEAGYKSAQWNASGFASGVYLYRLQARNYVAVRKMIVAK